MNDILAGIYRHYKGTLYLVLGLAHDANAGELYSNRSWIARSSERHPLGEREVVVYVPLQLDEDHTGARLAVRTLDDFFALVHQDGSVCEGVVCIRQHDGSTSQCNLHRFTYVGARWDG